MTKFTVILSSCLLSSLAYTQPSKFVELTITDCKGNISDIIRTPMPLKIGERTKIMGKTISLTMDYLKHIDIDNYMYGVVIHHVPRVDKYVHIETNIGLKSNIPLEIGGVCDEKLKTGNHYRLEIID